MLYRISVTERGLTGITNIFRSRLSRLDDLLGAGTVPLIVKVMRYAVQTVIQYAGLQDPMTSRYALQDTVFQRSH